MIRFVKYFYLLILATAVIGSLVVSQLDEIFQRYLVGFLQPCLDLLIVIGISLLIKKGKLPSNSGIKFLLAAYIFSFIYICIYHYYIISEASGDIPVEVENPPVWTLAFWIPFLIFLILFWSKQLWTFLKKDYENKSYTFVAITMVLVCIALWLHFRDLANYDPSAQFKKLFYTISVVLETINFGILISTVFLLNKLKTTKHLVISMLLLFSIEVVFCNIEFTQMTADFPFFAWELGWSSAQLLTCSIILFRQKEIIEEINQLHSDIVIKSDITISDSLKIFIACSTVFLVFQAIWINVLDYYKNPLQRGAIIFGVLICYSLVVAYLLPNFRESRMEAKLLRKHKILFISANPAENHANKPLDIEKEFKDLETEIRGTKYRDNFQLLTPVLAAAPEDIIKKVRFTNPTIVHFSGHGSELGIFIRDSTTNEFVPASGEKLRRFFEGRGVELVILNSCYSENQAGEISKVVKTVIGTSNNVPDKAAKQFTRVFYGSLCDGLTIEEALKDGKDAANFEDGDVYISSGEIKHTLVFMEDNY